MCSRQVVILTGEDKEGVEIDGEFSGEITLRKVVALAHVDFRQVIICARSNKQIDARPAEDFGFESFLEELGLSGDRNTGPVIELNCSKAPRISACYKDFYDATDRLFRFLGNGDTKMVHHPEFVFNQDILPIGAAYWVALTEGYLR